MASVADIIEYLNQFAPSHLAADWDNVGLLLGDRGVSCERVMTCLTLTPTVAQEAIQANAQLIVAHHPILFRPVQRLTTGTPEGRMLLSLVKAGVAVYSPHTAFDNTAGGINDSLARRMGLVEVVPLRRREGTRQSKIVVFVPDADLIGVSDAMFSAGAGHIGEYSQCSYRVSGTGTFFGSDATQPTVGQKGRREEVSEWRLEVLCPENSREQVIEAMRRTHSYEEPAYDVYPLQPATVGEGRVGRLKQSQSLEQLAQTAKQVLKAAYVQIVGDPGRSVERVALACGAGGEFLMDAVRANADVFLTGEVRFHDYLAAQANGLALVLPGHYATERFGIEELADRLHDKFAELKVWPSKSESDPVRWI
ncbi:MAG TPA: Nif3-like dinuclear metal center hexameric protein [Gemmataceae bacterium]|jgi:dinuclear metal center YbgI/SA1388 family protein|nr:Nif3-like dinuclear metal center hexameric protein [Gemmataceae bacterium]